jgi:Surfeit locus protein 6
LDPDSAKTAKDVMDENARKRKREESNDLHSPDEELGSELPREGLRRGNAKTKKQKKMQMAEKDRDYVSQSTQEVEERLRLRVEKRAQKAAQREKKTKKAAEQGREQGAMANVDTSNLEAPGSHGKTNEQPSNENDDNTNRDSVNSFEELSPASDVRPPEHDSTTSSTPISYSFDAPNPDSGASSISSIIPPSDTADVVAKPLKATPEELKTRLQKRLDELRAARHADGLDGKPARNRQELIEARRLKAEQRKAHKKELRRKEKEEEQRLKDEAIMRRFSPGGPGSVLASPRSPAESNTSTSNNYSFGRIAFADGQHVDPTLSHLVSQPRRHGPQDPGTALKAAETKKARLAALDPAKRTEIEEKDMWLNAKRRAHGERVRDDTLLKKTLKRKVSAKKKSEREWKERLEGVAKNKEMKKTHRDENIRKRKEEKGKKKSGKGKARPGFEGTFKTKVGSKKR